MENINRIKLNKYSQVYDYLKTTHFIEFLQDRRNNIHNELFNNAVNNLIKDVNGNCETMLASNVSKEISKFDITQLNSTDFQILEFKNKVWYKPSNILIIYTKELVNVNGIYRRLRFGPYKLDEYWNNEYIMKRNINNIVCGSIHPKYEIQYIDYVDGTVTIYDKLNDNTMVIDISYINIDTPIADDYKDRMFTKMRNISFI